MIGLDSNVVVRYLAQDDARQAAAATRLIEQELGPAQPGFLSLVALAETVWVMVSVYGAGRTTVATTVEELLSAANIRVQDAEDVWRALEQYRKGKADFSDCLIGTVARARGCGWTATFDKAAAHGGDFRLLK